MTGGSYLTTNKNYQVTVARGNPSGASAGITGGLSVVANASAKLRIAIENRWINVLEALGIDSGSSDSTLATIKAGLQIIGGANFMPQIATSHVWTGSSGIELTLDMRFDAWSDPVKDVIVPVQTLVAMYSPLRQGGSNLGGINLTNATGAGGAFLQPPGPTPYSWLNNGYADPMAITVLIGTCMHIYGLIPTTLGWEFEERFDINGNPMCALVSASFISYVIPALQDILSFFVNQGAVPGLISAETNSNAASGGSSAPTTNPNVATPSNNGPIGTTTGPIPTGPVPTSNSAAGG